MYTTLQKQLFLQLVEYIFECCVFSYEDEIYLQRFGVAMGNTASVIISSLVMEAIFDHCIKQLDFKLPFLYVFVDDCLTAIPFNKIEYMLNILNNFDINLNFTFETYNVNREIPFLDTLLIVNAENKIEISWYQKPTASNRYIHFNSCHPIHMKINLIKALKHRITNICSEKYVKHNIDKLKHILVNNNYPIKLINKILYNDLKNSIPSNKNMTLENTKYFTLPYIPGLTDKIKAVLPPHDNIKIATYNPFSLNALFSKLKDQTPVLAKCEVVYKIVCSCNKVYIGQTKQILKSRVRQHISDEKSKLNKCALANHIKEKNHLALYDETMVLCTERNLEKRLFLELYYINEYRHETINSKTDIDGISDIYCNLFQLFSNK